MKKINLSFLLVVAFASLLWLPNLFTKGMFVDGVYNALFAHNLVHDVGSFWTPQTADYAQPSYWDNPQLSAYILSIWYKLFGDYYWVEKLYSRSTVVVQLVLIAVLWKINFPHESEHRYYWLPCVLFMIIPLTSWGYSSNLMENTMSLFTTASVIMFLIFLRTQKYLLTCAISGGVLIFLAILTKGPVALFPLVVPVFFLLLEKNFSWNKALAYAVIQLTVTVIIFGIVFSMDQPKTFLLHYLDVQLFRALSVETEWSASRFIIVVHLFSALFPLVFLSLISLFISKKNISENRLLMAHAFVFILIGLSASLPIILSAKQNKHYLIPSLPLFAVSFACLILPLVKLLKERINTQITVKTIITGKAFCFLIIAGCIFLSVKNAGEYSRDESLLKDIEAIYPFIKQENVIRADWSLYSDWALRANLNRLYDKKICMPDDRAETVFYLTKTNERGDRLPETAKKLYKGIMFDLYQISL